MNDFLTLGELLIDFTPSGEAGGQKLFMQNAGGAVANVAAAISGFGVSAAYIGMVGNDVFGRYLKQVLEDKGVDTSGLVMSDDYNTTLAFVHLFENGDRDFSFYRKPGADIMYEEKYLKPEIIKQAKVFHFGSLSLTDEPARSATFAALKIAKENGVVVSYDPNYRAPLWKSEETAREYMLRGLEYADILKVSDSEVSFLFGDMDYSEAARMLLRCGVKLVFITLGGEGAVYGGAAGTGAVSAYSANVVDTTGAGDCFTAGVLYRFIKDGKKLDVLTLCDMHDYADFACAAASLCVEGKGGIPSMPSLKQVEERLSRK
ncbi:MAG: carbohydrate kinase family protein [Burkholderiales bacterium]